MERLSDRKRDSFTPKTEGITSDLGKEAHDSGRSENMVRISHVPDTELGLDVCMLVDGKSNRWV